MAEPTPQEKYPIAVAFAITGAIGFVLFFVWIIAREYNSSLKSEMNVTAESAQPSVAEPEPRVTPQELLMAVKTLPGALLVSTSLFADASNAIDPWTALFAVWCSKHLHWFDLYDLSKTTHAKAMKDIRQERGKRLCVKGKIIEISVDRNIDPPVFQGGIMSGEIEVTRFIAIGSTGELVAGDSARFCGVVTGKQSFSNTLGGTTNAVFSVGMFRLPENTILDAGTN